MSNFKIGDIVIGLNCKEYGVTDSNTIMRVIAVFSQHSIKVKVLDRIDKHYLNEEYTVRSKHFKKVETIPYWCSHQALINEILAQRTNIINADLITAGTVITNVGSPDITQEFIDGVLCITVDKRYTICTDGTKTGISVKHADDKYNEELGKALAFYRYHR
jgi:hypothetical protein